MVGWTTVGGPRAGSSRYSTLCAEGSSGGGGGGVSGGGELLLVKWGWEERLGGGVRRRGEWVI